MTDSNERWVRVPVNLLGDPLLTPLERNVWALFQFSFQDRFFYKLPSDDEVFRQLVSDAPFALASPNRVSRACMVLRMAGWLVKYPMVYDDHSNDVLPVRYQLQQTSLPISQRAYYDPTFAELLQRCKVHSSEGLRVVATKVLDELTEKSALAEGEGLGLIDWSAALEKVFFTTSELQQAINCLVGLSSETQQLVIKEFAARCQAGEVKTPLAYLRTLANRARQGLFVPWAG